MKKEIVLLFTLINFDFLQKQPHVRQNLSLPLPMTAIMVDDEYIFLRI